MANEPLADFLDALLIKFQSSVIVTNPENIGIGESSGISHLNDDRFPRLEVLIDKIKGNGIIDTTRILDQSFRVRVKGHLRRASNSTTSQDMFDAIALSREIQSFVYSLNTDRAEGNAPCDGFIKIDGFFESFISYERIPKHTSVIFVVEADIQLTDIYTNN